MGCMAVFAGHSLVERGFRARLLVTTRAIAHPRKRRRWMGVVTAGAVANAPLPRMVGVDVRVATATCAGRRATNVVRLVAARALGVSLVVGTAQHIEVFVAAGAGCRATAVRIVRFVTAHAFRVAARKECRRRDLGVLLRMTGLAVVACCAGRGVLILVARRAGGGHVLALGPVCGAHLFVTLVARSGFWLCVGVGVMTGHTLLVAVHGDLRDRALARVVAAGAIVGAVVQTSAGISLGSLHEALEERR